MRRRRAGAHVAVVACLLAVGLAVLSPPPVAVAQERTPAEIAQQLREAEQRRIELDEALQKKVTDIAAAREQLVSIRTRLEDARARLATAEGLVAYGEDALAAAEERRKIAQDNLAEAERLLRLADEALAREEATLDDQAASAYKYGSVNRSEMWLRVVRESDDPNDLARNIYRLRSMVDYQDDVVQRVLELRIERERLRQEAIKSRDVAQQREQEAEVALEVLDEQRAMAQAIADQIAQAEQRQTEILASLEADAETIAGLQEDVDARYAELRAELDEQVEARRAQQIAAGAATYCPVQGAKTGRDFINDWGFPRSGGRTHEGLDIFASRGTPVVAMFEGTVKETRRTETGLGGRVVSYWVGPNEYYYNAHLDTVAAGLEEGDKVVPGQVIGTVGNTGNARTTPPHLHLGHYVNGDAQPPYPLVSVACA